MVGPPRVLDYLGGEGEQRAHLPRLILSPATGRRFALSNLRPPRRTVLESRPTCPLRPRSGSRGASTSGPSGQKAPHAPPFRKPTSIPRPITNCTRPMAAWRSVYQVGPADGRITVSSRTDAGRRNSPA